MLPTNNKTEKNRKIIIKNVKRNYFKFFKKKLNKKNVFLIKFILAN